jgi:hypothetical protein
MIDAPFVGIRTSLGGSKRGCSIRDSGQCVLTMDHSCGRSRFTAEIRSYRTRAGAGYRELGGKLRELARTCVYPGPRRSLARLAGAFDRRAANFHAKGTGQDPE